MKIVELYAALSGKDLKRFDQYLKKQIAEASVVYRLHRGLMEEPDPDITLDWLYLVGYQEPAKGPSLSKEEKNRLNRNINSLRKHLNDFIVLTVRDNKISDLLYLAAGYSRLKLYDFLPTVFNKIDREFANLKSQNLEVLFQKYTYQEIRFHYNIIKHNKGKNFGFQDLLNSLNDFLLCSKLRYYCAGQNRENILSVKYKYNQRDSLIQYMDKALVGDLPVFAIIYRMILDLLSGNLPSGKAIELVQLIEKNESEILKTEQRQMYGFIVNYLNDQIREGQSLYRKELFNTYRLTLDKGIWSDNIYFSKHQFLLIVRNALTIGEQKWTVAFVDKYSKKLNPNDKEAFFNWAQAYINFYKGDFDLADSFWQKVGMGRLGPLYNLLYKVLGIMIKYEQLNQEEGTEWAQNNLYRLVEGLRLILLKSGSAKRNPLSIHTLERFDRFGALVKRIFNIRFFKLKEGRSLNILNNIKRDIQIPKQLEEREWLLKKINEML